MNLPSYKEQPVMAALVTLFFVSASLLMLAHARNAQLERKYIGQIPDQRDTITIEGEGKVTSKPTLARVNLGLYSEGADVPTVQADNTRKVDAMIAGLKDLGIAEADLQTSNYSIAPKYDYKDGSQRVVAYTVNQSLTAKVRDLSKVGTVLSRVAQLGANQVNGVEFTIDDPKSLTQEARFKALEDARAKAQELATALGVEIVHVVTFTEAVGTPSNPTPMYRTEVMNQAVAAAPVPDIQPGSLDVVSHVSVTYQIR